MAWLIFNVGQNMNPVFKNRVWELSVTPPWRATDCEHCVEITQPDGVGAIHISSARKKEGLVADSEALAQLKGACPDDTDSERARCGDFSGYVAEYVDWNTSAFWKKWFVSCRKDLLFVSYTCKLGDQELEIDQVSALLATLRSKS